MIPEDKAEIKRKQHRLWIKNNPDKVKKYSKEYYLINRTTIDEKVKKYTTVGYAKYNNKLYTDQEIQIIRNSKLNNRDLALKLNRTVHGLAHKRQRLGIKGKNFV